MCASSAAVTDQPPQPRSWRIFGPDLGVRRAVALPVWRLDELRLGATDEKRRMCFFSKLTSPVTLDRQENKEFEQSKKSARPRDPYGE